MVRVLERVQEFILSRKQAGNKFPNTLLEHYGWLLFKILKFAPFSGYCVRVRFTQYPFPITISILPMKKSMYLLLFAATALLMYCKNAETGPWADFKKCGGNNCVTEALAVKDLLLSNPKRTLADFQRTYEKGEDHVVGWLYILRDSVLTNSARGSVEQRFAMQQAIIAAVKPLENDPQVGESAKTILGEVEMLAIASELEDDIVEPSSDPITGTYGFDTPNFQGTGELEVSQTAFDKIKFKLSVFGAGEAPNQGFMEGEATLSPQNVAKYSLNEYGGECTLQFTWKADGVEIETLAGTDAFCGFGANVKADGTYKRQSFNDPFLGKADARTVGLLQGEWQSADDPKASVKIANGQYIDLYEGQEPLPARYIYYPVCPQDCNPVGKMPCLKVIGQDDICYSIVKADGKVLEISQIGGTGNTNRYVRKKG